jgi:DNA repair photolyase
MNLKIKELNVKSIITKSNIPGIDYVANPYVGCVHSCIYCYARFMKKFTGHTEPWGSFVDIKINAPDLIPSNTKKFLNKTILMSSVTDPYLWLENKYQLSRQIIAKLISLQPNLLILTKAALVVRDIELLKQFSNCDVGFSITTLDEILARELEPQASSPYARIEALKTLKQAGIKTYVFIAPIMPFITDWKNIIEHTAPYTDYYLFDKLNLKGDIWGTIGSWLISKHPELHVKYREIYLKPNNYWITMKSEIDVYCRQHNLNQQVFIRSNNQKPLESKVKHNQNILDCL